MPAIVNGGLPTEPTAQPAHGRKQDLRAAQCRIKADALCYVSEHRACCDGIVLHRRSANERLTLRRLEKAQEQVECGRLPGTVSTKEANDFTHSNFQIQIVERNRFSKGLRQIPCFKNRVTSCMVGHVTTMAEVGARYNISSSDNAAKMVSAIAS